MEGPTWNQGKSALLRVRALKFVTPQWNTKGNWRHTQKTICSLHNIFSLNHCTTRGHIIGKYQYEKSMKFLRHLPSKAHIFTVGESWLFLNDFALLPSEKILYATRVNAINRTLENFRPTFIFMLLPYFVCYAHAPFSKRRNFQLS